MRVTHGEKDTKVPYAEERKLFALVCREAMVQRYGRELSAIELAERFKQVEEEDN